MMASKANAIVNGPFVHRVTHFVKQASPRARLLAGVWLLFFVLVAFGIHRSSTALTAAGWMPEKPYTGCLFAVSPEREHELSKGSTYGLQTLLLANARYFRWDEAYIATPYALSQLAQQPRFPVINPSFGNGQNMLIERHTPVWHIATLARPATWGYFLLGAQRGLAWYWWFQPLACFTVLFLLLEIVFNNDWKLAALGAVLFGSSAYVILWSQWPAYVTFFAALACLATYHLCRSERRRTLLVCALLLRGIYNVMTCNTGVQGLKNESESASFYYFFPAVFLALPLSKRLLRGLGVVGWSLVIYIAGMIFFLMVGVPAFVAKVTLLRFVPSNRADLTIGLASIILSLYALTILRNADQAPASRLHRWMPVLAGAGVVFLCIVHSLYLL